MASTRNGVVRTTVSIDALVYAAAERRKVEMQCANLTEYFEALIRDDNRLKPREIGAHYDMEELRQEAQQYIERAARAREKDRLAKARAAAKKIAIASRLSNGSASAHSPVKRTASATESSDALFYTQPPPPKKKKSR